METKKAAVPIILAILSLAFLITCLMVYLHNGKSAKWIARKMKLGGFMLTLSALLSACDASQTAALEDNNPPWICYDVVAVEDMENRFYVNNISDSVLTLKLPNQNSIEGEIKKRTSEHFSYAIYNSDNEKCEANTIVAHDGAMNNDSENFVITIDKTLPKGDYIVRFYTCEVADQPTWSNQYINLKLK